jgi:GNAT superfamily N-acetyltransferase
MIIPTIRRLADDCVDDFMRLHESCGGGCFCAAWWVPTWAEWGERSAEQNRDLRRDLIARGETDGYLFYLDDRAVGWCQVGRRDRLAKLVAHYGLDPEPDVWAITCVLLLPAHRHEGHARRFIELALEDLRSRGVERVHAFPIVATGLPDDEVWTGPVRLFESLGFTVLRAHERLPVLEWRSAEHEHREAIP